MELNRKQFSLGAAALGITAGSRRALAQATDSRPTTPSGANQDTHFFRDSAFEYVLLGTLGRAYHGGGNVGKVLYVIRQIEDGNPDSAFAALTAAAAEARAIAEASAAGGHRESARQAYLWAQNFLDSAMYFADGTGDPTRVAATWEQLDACWLASLPFFNPPIEQVSIPYENTALRGFFFRGRSTAPRRPLLILVNGSDGSLFDMWMMGGAGGTARGYDCLTFDGPGQGHALWRQNLHFRPDWEKVLTPVVDFALARDGVDPERIAVQGISQGGYWVPRAVAFEKRVRAAIADPGVVDVSASWTATLPPPMIQLLRSGNKAAFDGFLDRALDVPSKRALQFRMRPYGVSSYFDAFRATLDYNLEGIAGRITCPMLVTDPANEAFWPGQSRRLHDALTSPRTLVPFTKSDGADLHCEPNGLGLRDLRIFDWLDTVMR